MRSNSRFHRTIASFRNVAPLAVGLLLGLGSSARADSPEHTAIVSIDRLRQVTDVPTGAVCGGGTVRCFAHVHATESGHVKAYAAPQGFGPTDLQSAYGIDPTHVVPSTAPTVAVIDAYGYASLESDLAAYRSQYGLPACTTANGCLKIVNQNGQTSPLPGAPPQGDDWTIETALDVDMVSAACPSCKIVVVQATDDQGDGLFVANNVPSTLGATVVRCSGESARAEDPSPSASPSASGATRRKPANIRS